ncbi:MAG: nucleotidyl transferase AbiEii/AbiGii toxin family protein, partial [Byssovorax sp.]
MAASQLSPLQEEILLSFFEREDRFFLSGGAALAGFHLKHRRTADPDLFADKAGLLEAGESALRAVAAHAGAIVKNVQTEPTIRRRLLERGDDRVMVDLVMDEAVQGYPDKLLFGAVRVDPPEEILANKLCTLLSRNEIRDLVDVHALERAGFRVEDAVALAQRKDGGFTPATLAWLLSEIQIGDDARIPGGITPAQ